ncbi:MAG: flagellar hook-associated protein FlgK [Acidobacteria bacterium]|nr:flagellar hook-associated protein FlgK [Acidobacteriota bacterium]
MTTFSHFAIGRSAMRAFRLGMDLAGYNVANSQTPGFSRRRIELGMLPIVNLTGGLAGIGVDVVSMHRVRDPFLDFSVRREMSRYGSDSTRTEVLSAFEPTLGEIENSTLQEALTGLFDAFEQVAVQPDSIALREDVIAAAQRLASGLQRADAYVVESRRTANERIGSRAERVNEIVRQLAKLNSEIVSQESGGAEASDLRDERDRLLDELSGLVAIRAVEEDDGAVSVFLDGPGDPLLVRLSARPLELRNDSDGLVRIYVSRGGESVDLTSSLRGGELGGYLQVRDTDLAGYRDRLNVLASAVIEQFNQVHAAGFDLDGNGGLNLFEPDPPGDNAAAAIHVNAVVAADARRIAASGVAGEPFNNTNVLALLALREQPIASLGTRSFGDYAADIVAQVGRDSAEGGAAVQASQVILDSLDQMRNARSAVSLDEEAAELIKWQQSFDAAARFMQVVNRVTETALTLLTE